MCNFNFNHTVYVNTNYDAGRAENIYNVKTEATRQHLS